MHQHMGLFERDLPLILSFHKYLYLSWAEKNLLGSGHVDTYLGISPIGLNEVASE